MKPLLLLRRPWERLQLRLEILARRVELTEGDLEVHELTPEPILQERDPLLLTRNL